MKRSLPLLLSALSSLALVPGLAHASTVAGNTTVAATASVYAAGSYASQAPGFSATTPTAITLGTGATQFSFLNSGIITVNGGTLNDADGIGSVSGEYNSGNGSLSGITAPTAGFIAGVFVAAGGPSGTTPAALNFTTSGTSFSTLSPLLNQVFFIGDGLTGDGTGSSQTFYVPTGAGTLYLGLTDACGYYGSPSCYGDNSGTFNVAYTETLAGTAPPVSVTPEPSSFVLLGTGLLGAAGAARRRFLTR